MAEEARRAQESRAGGAARVSHKPQKLGRGGKRQKVDTELGLLKDGEDVIESTDKCAGQYVSTPAPTR